MKKLVNKEAINTILVIIFAYMYLHYVAPYINSFFRNLFVSWGCIIVIIGIWGNLVKMVLIRSVFNTDSYKKENYFFILLGFVLLSLGIVKNLL